MESDMILEEQIHKKGRHRKKQLYNSIMQQMEFYFSDSNLSKDKFLLPLVEENPDVDISIFLKFNKIRKLTTNTEDIVKAIKNSQFLELSEDRTKIRRKTPIQVKENVNNCTLYVERIKVDATHEWLASLFSEFGTVTYVAIPKYKHNKMNKGFAFVEFEKEEEATEALNYFESIGCRMSALIAPETLCSIVTYEGKKTSETEGENISADDNDEDTENSKKRKLSTEESEENRKKIKVDNSTADVDDVGESATGDDYEEKKRKKHKKMKRKILRELGMQVLSKLEWKKIRNRYLDNQKAKMKQLKQFLNKKRFTNYMEMKQKGEPKNVNGTETTTDKTVKEKQEIAFVPGVIVKVQFSETYDNVKKIKEDLKQYSSEIKYIEVLPNANEGYLRFEDNAAAVKFCSSDYKGQSAAILKGEEEQEYWSKINIERSQKFNKNKKRLRGREKLLKRAEKELGKHIKFDDAD